MEDKIINYPINEQGDKIINCPINEQTADGRTVGRCWFNLTNNICSRHGDVSVEVKHFEHTKKLTLENNMRKRKNLPLLG